MSETSTDLSGSRKLFFGLFIFPLVIAVGMAVLLCTVVFLTMEEQSPQSLISAIKSGSPTQRWQKAFELSNELNRSEAGRKDPDVMRGIIHILEDVEHYDAKTRAYMAIAVSHFNRPEAAAALKRSAQDSDPDVQLYSLWGLGTLKAADAYETILPFLKSENQALRKVACHVLGSLGDRRAIEPLRICLNDSVSDVKWNASLALARLGDDAGAEILRQMLDRRMLTEGSPMTEEGVESAMINATRGLALIGDDRSIGVLKEVAASEKNLKVRQAAMNALDAIKGKSVHGGGLRMENIGA